jgi:hypothetical protein
VQFHGEQRTKTQENNNSNDCADYLDKDPRPPLFPTGMGCQVTGMVVVFESTGSAAAVGRQVQQPPHCSLLLGVTILEPQSLQATHISLEAKKTREKTCKISMKEEEKTCIYEIFTYIPVICSGYTRDIVVVETPLLHLTCSPHLQFLI